MAHEKLARLKRRVWRRSGRVRKQVVCWVVALEKRPSLVSFFCP